jgi:hypothetical protein
MRIDSARMLFSNAFEFTLLQNTELIATIRCCFCCDDLVSTIQSPGYSEFRGSEFMAWHVRTMVLVKRFKTQTPRLGRGFVECCCVASQIFEEDRPIAAKK